MLLLFDIDGTLLIRGAREHAMALHDAIEEVWSVDLREVRERRPVGVQVTVSIGVAISEEELVDTDDLMARADAALYAAKAGGRNQVFIDN